MKYLRIIQIFFQLKNRIVRVPFREVKPSSTERNYFHFNSILKPKSFYKPVNFSFLNITKDFEGWNDTSNGMLWAYNLNYMDWLNQEDLTFEEGEKWIVKFIKDLPNNKIGLDPYPTALRTINWIKFISKFHNQISSDKLQEWNNSLYSQIIHLSKSLEYYLLGNHLLEDAFALYIGASYFNDIKLLKKAKKLLLKELREQTLQDGAHFEQSPMYHCILLDRLLDCININPDKDLVPFAEKMLGHLESIVWADGSIPLLNDSAMGIAPSPNEIFDYAKRLGLSCHKIPLKDSGYRKLVNDSMEVIADVGNITASYQPGHSHADTFNFELRIDGKPFIIDTGISTYEKNARRQYERSTIAHNTVTPIDLKDSSQVWGGFRVAKRAKVKVLEEKANFVSASHNGYGENRLHTRSYSIEYNKCIINDSFLGDGIAHFIFDSSVKIESIQDNIVITNLAKIEFSGANSIKVKDIKVSAEYNNLISSKKLEVYLSDSLSTFITPKVL